ncbi:MAG: aspartate--ammonia ligase [Corallococcus sp.]|nr:aspartate--ammonia ligase [Corallococcus sp.]
MNLIKDKYVYLDILEKQKYIKLIKDKFERDLARELNLTRVSAPLLVTKESGLQDDLSGTERKVAFDVLKDGKEVEIVQSLAKWKRTALKKYNFAVHKGLYADMTAIRRDDKMDELHSIYVDQWDWEKVITETDRNETYLKNTVKKIVKAIKSTNEYVIKKGFDKVSICDDVFFVNSQKLADMYPDSSAKVREYLVTKRYKTVFVTQIGYPLKDGKPHDLRAPDYDDWTLNGDLLFYHEALDCALELSSMGIRVNKETLLKQVEITKNFERLYYDYHKAILSDALPQTIGGGIGQSRLCMLLLGRAHIGEVQSSYWDEQTTEECLKAGIELL